MWELGLLPSFAIVNNATVNMGVQPPLWDPNFIFYLFIYLFFGPHLQYMEVPRLGVELELLLLAYTTATATPDPSRVCNLHHRSWQHWILNPLSEARDQT